MSTEAKSAATTESFDWDAHVEGINEEFDAEVDHQRKMYELHDDAFDAGCSVEEQALYEKKLTAATDPEEVASIKLKKLAANVRHCEEAIMVAWQELIRCEKNFRNAEKKLAEASK